MPIMCRGEFKSASMTVSLGCCEVASNLAMYSLVSILLVFILSCFIVPAGFSQKKWFRMVKQYVLSSMLGMGIAANCKQNTTALGSAT